MAGYSTSAKSFGSVQVAVGLRMGRGFETHWCRQPWRQGIRGYAADVITTNIVEGYCSIFKARRERRLPALLREAPGPLSVESTASRFVCRSGPRGQRDLRAWSASV